MFESISAGKIKEKENKLHSTTYWLKAQSENQVISTTAQKESFVFSSCNDENDPKPKWSKT